MRANWDEAQERDAAAARARERRVAESLAARQLQLAQAWVQQPPPTALEALERWKAGWQRLLVGGYQECQRRADGRGRAHLARAGRELAGAADAELLRMPVALFDFDPDVHARLRGQV